MSVISSDKNSDDNQIEPRKELPGTIDDRTEHDRLRFKEFKKLLQRREKIFPVLIAVFWSLFIVFSSVAFFLGSSLTQYHLESITELAKTFSWIAFLSTLVYMFGESMLHTVMGKSN